MPGKPVEVDLILFILFDFQVRFGDRGLSFLRVGFSFDQRIWDSFIFWERQRSGTGYRRRAFDCGLRVVVA